MRNNHPPQPRMTSMTTVTTTMTSSRWASTTTRNYPRRVYSQTYLISLALLYRQLINFCMVPHLVVVQVLPHRLRYKIKTWDLAIWWCRGVLKLKWVRVISVRYACDWIQTRQCPSTMVVGWWEIPKIIAAKNNKNVKLMSNNSRVKILIIRVHSITLTMMRKIKIIKIPWKMK